MEKYILLSIFLTIAVFCVGGTPYKRDTYTRGGRVYSGPPIKKDTHANDDVISRVENEDIESDGAPGELVSNKDISSLVQQLVNDDVSTEAKAFIAQMLKNRIAAMLNSAMGKRRFLRKRRS